MRALIKNLGIDERFTRPIKKAPNDSVKANTFPKEGYNYMADLLYLPETKEKYKYLLTMVDLWSNEVDFEPMKDREAKDAIHAMENIFKRKYLKKPLATIRTDNGPEFRGVFHNWLYHKNILHREALPYRHNQMGNIENLNKQLGRIFNGYMNSKELKTGKVYKEWTDIVPTVRKSLNEIRQPNPDSDPYEIPMIAPTLNKEAYKVGDVVYAKLEIPRNALGKKQSTPSFREGDYRWDIKNPRLIKQVLYYPNNIRYTLEGLPNVSYPREELKKARGNDNLIVPHDPLIVNSYLPVSSDSIPETQIKLFEAYKNKVGKKIKDIEDNIIYKVDNIVRKKRSRILLYQYHEANMTPESETDYEYSTVVEMFNNPEYWKWQR